MLNQTSRALALAPKLKLINSFNENEYYKIRFIHNSIDNRVIPVTLDVADKFKELIIDDLFISNKEGSVYYNGTKFIDTLFDDDSQKLKALDEDAFTDNIYFDLGSKDNAIVIDDVFLSDILVSGYPKEKLDKISEKVNNLGFDVKFISLKKELNEERNYYLDGLMYGVIVILISLSFNTLIVSWIIKRTIIINKQFIYLLRVSGLSCTKIKRIFVWITLIPMLFGCVIAYYFNSNTSILVFSSFNNYFFTNSISIEQLLLITALLMIIYIILMFTLITIVAQRNIKGELLR